MECYLSFSICEYGMMKSTNFFSRVVKYFHLITHEFEDTDIFPLLIDRYGYISCWILLIINFVYMLDDTWIEFNTLYNTYYYTLNI